MGNQPREWLICATGYRVRPEAGLCALLTGQTGRVPTRVELFLALPRRPPPNAERRKESSDATRALSS